MIDMSEPECSNCFHCRTSGILNSQEPEPSNVIGSSVPSMPVSSGPVQALGGHGSASVGSTSTSTPVHSSSPLRFGSAHALTSVSSVPTQALGPTTFDFGSSAAPTPPSFGSMEAPVQATFGSGACSTSTPFSFLPFGVLPAPSSSTTTVVFGTTPVSVPSLSGPKQDIPWATNSFSTGCGIERVRSDVGSSPASSSSYLFGPNPSTTASVCGTTPASVPSLFGPAQDFPKTTSVCVSSTPAPTRCGIAFARSDVGSSPASSSSYLFGPNPSTTASVFGTTPVSVPSLSGPKQDMPWATNSFSTGCGIERVRSGFGSSPASSSSYLFGPNPSTTASVFGTSAASVSSLFQPGQHPLRSGVPKPTSVCASSTPTNPLSSSFPGFGVDYLPGSSSNPFGPNPSFPSFGGGYVLAGVKTSSPPKPFGFNATTTLLPSSSSSSSSSSSAMFSSNPNIGSQLFASHDWSRCTEQGSRFPGYAPTPDGQRGDMYISISASNSYLNNSHDELRWEDYKQGVKGGSFPAPNAVLSPSTASPSIFASPSIPDHPQMTHFGTTQGNFTGSVFGGVKTSSSSGLGQANEVFSFVPSSSSSSSTTIPPISSSVQRPHETTAVSCPASRCTACGALSSSSASGYFTFNGATTPPSAATSHPGLFFPTSGSGPMMFGATPQGTTPALQAYPVQGFILLPFAAMSLQ